MLPNNQKPFRPGQLRYREYFKVSKGEDDLGLWKYFYFRVYHPMFPTFFFGSIILLLTSLGKAYLHYSLLQVALLWLAGFFLWSFAEYLIHRFLFHYEVAPRFRKMFPDLHPAHHRDTRDRSLHIAPQAFALVLTSIFYGILWAVTQNWALAMILLSGILIGYIAYEWCHYGEHEYRWKRGFFGYLKRNHLVHHFKAPDKVYGVGLTASFWDYVFGTPLKSS